MDNAEDIGVGVIGVGDISSIYLQNLARFRGVRLVACAGRNLDAVARRAAQFGIEALTSDAMLRREDIGIVVNLTPPQAHAAVTMDALTAGKHVFSEKPLAGLASQGRALTAEATRRGLLIGCAPDTFLGAGGRLARQVADSGEVGTILSGTCLFMSHGMEHWHPNPGFFFRTGGGPVMDIGPYYLTTLVNLLGPIRSVQAEASSGFGERVVTSAGRDAGRRIKVETPTTAMALLRFQAGAVVNVIFSWDVWKHAHRPIELYGTEGSLMVPDPDTYGGSVETSRRDASWVERLSDAAVFGRPNWRPAHAPASLDAIANYRGLGVAEMASAISRGTPHRSSGQLAGHILEVMNAILTAASDRRAVTLEHMPDRPAAMSELEAADLLRL